MESSSSESNLYPTFARLVRVQTELWNAVDLALRAEHEVSLAQYTPLEVIAATDGCRVRDLVSILHITVGGASKVVDRLETTGYVERHADPHDRRSAVLCVTAAGQRLLASAAPTIERLLEQRLAGPLGARSLASLNQALLRLEPSRRPAAAPRGV
jgi:DNA-binding MarR family transcriptional regulator